MVPQRRVIDTHHHVFSPRFLAAKGERMFGQGNHSIEAMTWDADRCLETMDKAGVTRALLSQPAPWELWDSLMDSRRHMREVNEFAAQQAARSPDRFGVFASIPLPDTDGSLAEIAYAIDVLRVDGIALMTNYDGTHLGDRQFAAVLEELNRRRVLIHVHPSIAPCCKGLLPDMPDVLDYVSDTTRAIASLLFSGTLHRTRNIRWLFSHGGGVLPMLAGRFIRYAEANRERLGRFMPDGAMTEIRRLHFDTAQVARPEAFAGLRMMVPVSQIVFGSDSPMATIEPQLLAL
ncbi:hypothetical protein E3G68_005144 [Mycobacteroides abscessus]|uniref:amidohydrolase family protein n=1 Tax=Mycobacteroides abscessus TaxID=36809 RepID=UPI0018785CD2|nr:hypothetical protein [Mycobacteroides abscessus]